MLRDPDVEPLNNFAATTDPTVNDDANDGYSIGSRWINTSTDKQYICFDATVGAAVWQEAGGGAAHADTRDPLPTDDLGEGYPQGSTWVNTANQSFWASVDDTDDAAVWRNVTNLGHYYPYLVGPVGLAPYQTIQAAIDQAVVDGHDDSNKASVYVVPGTYADNIALKPGIDLVGLTQDFNDCAWVDYPADVKITGHLTFAHDSALSTYFTVTIRHFFMPMAGGSTPALTLSGSAWKWITFEHVRIQLSLSAGVRMFDNTANTGRSVYELIGTTVIATGSTALPTIELGVEFSQVYCRNSTIYAPSASNRAIKVTGTNIILYLYAGGLLQQTQIAGAIEVASGAVNAQLYISESRLSPYSGSAIIIDGTITSGSVLFDSWQVDGNGSKLVTVGGVNAASLIEYPKTYAGTISRYDGARWAFVRNNFTATADPTANDDSTQGYAVGSLWFNSTTQTWYRCNNASIGAAVWYVVPVGAEVRLQTTDNTLTTAATIPLADPETAVVYAYITARRTDAVGAAAYERRAAFYRDGAGAVRINQVDTPLTRETDATWNVDLVASGNDALIKVRGAIGATVEWRVRYILKRM